MEVIDTEIAKPLYTSRIIKASALLPDTRTLFSYWDLDLTPRENLNRVRSQNLLGKASRSRVEDILAIFRQRYLQPRSVATALSILIQEGVSPSITDRVFYYYSAQSDSLLHDVVTDMLVPVQWTGLDRITEVEVEAAVRHWVQEGKTTSRWTDTTIHRVAQGVMSTLRDFGVLTGRINKSLAPIYLPIKAFAFIAFDLKERGLGGERLVQCPEWQLFFLQQSAVERFFAEAHQQHLLEYHAAGSVVRVDFPANSLEEYARALTQRAH